MGRILSTRIVIALTIVFGGAIPLEAEAGPPRTRKGSGKPGASSQHRAAAAAPTNTALLSCLLGKVSDTGSAAAVDLQTANEWDAFRAAIASDPARSSKPDQLDGLTAQSFMSELLGSEHFYREILNEFEFRKRTARGPFEELDVGGFELLHPDLQASIAEAIARRVVFDLPYQRDLGDLSARTAEAKKLGMPVVDYIATLRKLHWMMRNGHGPDVIEGIRSKLSVDGTALTPKIARAAARDAATTPAPVGPREMVARVPANDSTRQSLAAKGSWAGPSIAEMLASKDPPNVHALEAWTATAFPRIEPLFKTPYFAKTFYRVALEFMDGRAINPETLWVMLRLPENRAHFFTKLEREFQMRLTRSLVGLDAHRYRALLVELNNLQKTDPDSLTRIMIWQLLQPDSITVTNVRRVRRWWKLDPWVPSLPKAQKAFRSYHRRFHDAEGRPIHIEESHGGKLQIDPYYFAELTQLVNRHTSDLSSRQLIHVMAEAIRRFTIVDDHAGHVRTLTMFWDQFFGVFASFRSDVHFTPADVQVLIDDGINQNKFSPVGIRTSRASNLIVPALRRHFSTDAPPPKE